MIVRHILFAGLFATASFANAGTVDASTATVQPAFTFNAGASADATKPVAFQSSLAGPGGTWSSQSRLGDIGSSSMMLYTQTGSAFAAAPAATSTSTSTSATQTVAAPVVFTETAKAAPAATIAAPAATDMPATVVAADVVVNGGAPAALAADVPEPATGMLMLAGLLGAGFMTRRRSK